MQERRNSSVLAMELCLSCTKQLICILQMWLGSKLFDPYPSGLFHCDGVIIIMHMHAYLYAYRSVHHNNLLRTNNIYNTKPHAYFIYHVVGIMMSPVDSYISTLTYHTNLLRTDYTYKTKPNAYTISSNVCMVEAPVHSHTKCLSYWFFFLPPIPRPHR